MAVRVYCPECKIVRVNFSWSFKIPFLQTTDGNGEGEPIDSPIFSSRHTPDTRWKLIMFDRGTVCVIVAYRIDSKSRTYEVDPELFKILFQHKKIKFNYEGIMQLHPNGCQIPKSEVFLQPNDGKFHIYCVINALVKKDPASPADPPAIAINCSDGLMTQFQGLFGSMQFSDVIFNVSGREFPAHKIILIPRIKPFAAMFEHPTKENLTNHIDIDDVEPEVFQELLRFLYTGRLSAKTMDSMGVGLLIAADKYLLDDLKMECENYLLSKLSPVNCLELILNENLPGSAEYLKKEAVNYFRCHQEEVMASDQWKMLKQENPDLSFAFQEFVLINK